MAIEIRNERGEVADLYPDTAINIERNSPLFNTGDKFFQDISYPFNLPATAANEVFFGGGHLTDAANNTYRLPVQLIVKGIAFFAGILEYTITNGNFDATLNVNYAAVRDKIKNTPVNDIYVYENFPIPTTKAIMYAAAQNPGQYHYAFLPILHHFYSDINGVTATYYSNYWDHDLQEFKPMAVSGSPTNRYDVAHYKLKYIINIVFKFLGFETSGSFIEDPETDKIYCYRDFYNNKAFTWGTHAIFANNFTIDDFIKAIKQRFKLAIHFDTLHGKVVINNLKSLIDESDTINISDFVSTIKKIETPENEGFSVTLMPDNISMLYKDANNEGKFIPENKLIIGNGEKAEEIKVCALKTQAYEGYVMPYTKNNSEVFTSNTVFGAPRFLYYNGLKNVGGGKVFPEATTMELTAKDALWYRFINDSKSLALVAYFPAHVLLKLDTTKKISFTTPDGATITAVIEKIEFSAQNTDDELIMAEIKCWTVNFQPTTNVQVLPYTTIQQAENGTSFICKALFDTANALKIDVSLVYPAGTIVDYGSPLPADLVYSGTITASTDKFRVGGSNVFLRRHISISWPVIQLRVSIPPQKLIFGGREFTSFTQHPDGYWYINNLPADANVYNDALVLWLIY